MATFHNWKIGHINIRSSLPNIDHIKNVLFDLRLDILGLSESCLSEKNSDDLIFIEAYSCFTLDSNLSRGGGIAIYFLDQI